MDKIHLQLAMNNWWWAILIVLVFNAGRYMLFPLVAYFICYRAGAKTLKRFKIQESLPGKKQMKHELLYSFYSIIIFSLLLIAAYLLYINGHSTIYTDIGRYGYGYFFLSILMMVVLHDTFFYWVHRLLHTKWFLKNIHSVHHRSANPTPLASNSFHPGEALILGLFVFPLITIWPVHVLALLVFNTIVVVTNVVGHLGFEFIPQRLRNGLPGKFISSATYHNLHHQKSTRNFGLYFTFWDRLMKTAQHEKKTDQDKQHRIAYKEDHS